MPWVRYIRYLAVSLDLQETDDFKIWCITRDPKKFPWSSSDRAGTQPDISQQVADWAKRIRGYDRVQRSAWEFAKATGKQVVYEAMKWDKATGKPIGKVYVDQDGNEVDLGGRVFVPLVHPEAQAQAQDFFKRRAA